MLRKRAAVPALPRSLTIPTVMTLNTLANVRALMRHPGRLGIHVAAELEQATAGADTVDVAVALRLALMSENVECRPT